MNSRFLSSEQVGQLVQLRRHLHAHPELPDNEAHTAQEIVRFCREWAPDAHILEKIGGHGLLVSFQGAEPGINIMLRCELDALPITETSQLPHASLHPHIAHSCGHDGHIAMLCGVVLYLSSHPLPEGSVTLLFQPAEETGVGACRMESELVSLGISFDYAFALHNLPGAPLGQIVWHPQTYASASHGLEVEYLGKTAHASEPHYAITPTFAVMETIQAWMELVKTPSLFNEFVLITIVNVQIGEEAYGTTPGHGFLRATFRAYRQEDLDKLHLMAIEKMEQIAASHGIKTNHQLLDVFPATVNHPDANKVVVSAAHDLSLSVRQASTPLAGSDDFAFFTPNSKASFFDLGAGTQQPPLHDSAYDFPDALIPIGTDLWISIVQFLSK
ncbi:MAG: amidohydrolase [Prevotellaceae bacterium]|jgi:amidohydrolase|nr:amidohydrolase [Prevotellaceae bacterium]